LLYSNLLLYRAALLGSSGRVFHALRRETGLGRACKLLLGGFRVAGRCDSVACILLHFFTKRVRAAPEAHQRWQCRAVAGTKVRLFDDAAKLPGSRVLDGRILVEPIGMAVLKRRNVAAANYVDRYVAEAKAGGMVKQPIETAGLRGVVVAPGK